MFTFTRPMSSVLYVRIVHALTSLNSRYWYTRGWNLKAVAALIAGGVFSMLFQLSPVFANFSFFIGAIGSGLAYYAITGAERKAA